MAFFDFFNPKKIVLYLDKQSLTVLNEASGVGQSQLIFPSQMVSFLEVHDATQLEKTILNFLHTQKITGNAIVVLSNNLLFSIKIPTEILQDQTEIDRIFTSNIPFPTQSIISKYFLTGNNNEAVLIATNKTYFHSIVKALTDFGLKVEAVVPEIAFNSSLGGQLNQGVLIDSVNKEKKIVELTNYLI